MWSLDHTRRGVTLRIDSLNVSGQHAVMPENILHALVRVPGSARTDRFRVSEFSAQSNLALILGLVAEQPGRHLARVDEDERSVEKACNFGHLGALALVGLRVKGSAQREHRLVSPRVDVQNDPDLGKD